MFILKCRERLSSLSNISFHILNRKCFSSVIKPNVLLFPSRASKRHFNKLVDNKLFLSTGIRSITFKNRNALNIANNESQQYRCFRTSSPRNIHPALWVVFKPILKFAAILTGRGFRKWWKDLPQNKKKYVIDQIKANKRKIGITLSVILLTSLGYYLSHLEETPITKRKRFMAFNPKQLGEINEYELKHMMGKVEGQILPADHPATRKVQAVVQRILNANLDIKEIRDKKFGIAVIDSPIENAFVLPIGYVFVFTGMINICSNDDQLGIILAHEIAHCIQNHGAENVSWTHLLDLISIAMIAAIWTVVPSDSISLLVHWLYSKSIEILLELPYSRKIETEADMVGLQLAAKACFDVRESSAFWSKMAFLKRTFGQNQEIDFLSTHPTHEARSQFLDSIMTDAITVRTSCGCPNLSHKDPRNDVESVSQALEKARQQFFENNTKPVNIFKL